MNREEFLQNLDLSPLENEISKRTKIKDFKFDVREVKRNEFISLQCTTNYKDKSGIFKNAFSEVRVGTFNGSFSDDGIWCSVNLYYQIKNGGSNGVHLMFAWYNVIGEKWKFD